MLVSPSLLAANFACLEREIDMINRSRASMLHLDVMDGVFVPNISFGFPVISAVKGLCKKPLDVHLMIVNPQNYVHQCRDCGADIVNVHQEACVHLERTVQSIKEAGMLPAVTINPSTPVEMLTDIIDELHMVLVMSVNPGFGGQKFIMNTLNKVQRLRKMIKEKGCNTLIEIDGGVDLHTGALLAQAGADVLVSGSKIFNTPDPIDYIAKLAELGK